LRKSTIKRLYINHSYTPTEVVVAIFGNLDFDLTWVELH